MTNMLLMGCDSPSTTYTQRTLDDLGTPLSEVTFCVVDVETTGLLPSDCKITEIGATLFKGGESLGIFQTMVNPGCPIPTSITVLTGITDSMVVNAPTIQEVLPTFEEFVGNAILVGHNVRFDLRFLRAAALASGRPCLVNRYVDTCALARRLLNNEVENCRLETLAQCFRLDHRPQHRALTDALATADLLHLLIGRAGTLGVTDLDDLLELPNMVGHPQAGKLPMTGGLPRSPGVYMFRDRKQHVLYIGKAANLRSRVRSYFSSDRRAKVLRLLTQTTRISHIECATALEAAVTEIRLIHHYRPPFNRRGTNWSQYAYLKLSLNERFPRLSVVRSVSKDNALYVGPVPSVSFARRALEAIESVVPLRRCSLPDRSAPQPHPCTPAGISIATCPCSGQISPSDYQAVVDRLSRGLTGEPELLLGLLGEKMRRLAGENRFEEAAKAREQARVVADCLRRQRRFELLRRSGSVRIQVQGQGGVDLVDGHLERTWNESPNNPSFFPAANSRNQDPGDPVLKEEADELNCVASWLETRASQLDLVYCEGTLASPVGAIPNFDPSRKATAG